MLWPLCDLNPNAPSMNDSPLDLIIYSEPHPLELESGLHSQEHWETRLVFQLKYSLLFSYLPCTNTILSHLYWYHIFMQLIS